ncbi:MAG TPA: hypothetical protein VEQ14_09270 [Steroidobacteraceae bacterium]|nr:hypothetical protein [Steroidobacteraceae bacterium]
MNLTTRGKWLSAIAAAVGAWVFFGPKDNDSVEVSRSAAHPAARTAAAAASATAPRSLPGLLQALAQRVADPAAAPALFASHSWYVPPPPPPAPVAAAPEPPPKPVAPPLPYKLIGSYTPDGEKTVFFLSAGDKVFDVHVGETLDNTYSIDSYSNGQLVLTYKPLNEKQQLQLTGTAQ